MVVDPGGRWVATASDDIIRIWGTTVVQRNRWGVPIKLLRKDTDTADVWSLAVSPCGTYLASGAADGTFRIWKVTKNYPIAYFYKHPTGITHLTYSPNGDRLLTACDDGKIRCFDSATGETAWCLDVGCASSFRGVFWVKDKIIAVRERVVDVWRSHF